MISKQRNQIVKLICFIKHKKPVTLDNEDYRPLLH
jgi:hypothetical protein